MPGWKELEDQLNPKSKYEKALERMFRIGMLTGIAIGISIGVIISVVFQMFLPN